jgi:hypothetical protein
VLILNLSCYGYIKQDGVIKIGNGIMENRKWNYLSCFQAPDQEPSLAKVVLLDQTLPKMISETGNGIILTGNGIISPTFMPLIKKLL